MEQGRLITCTSGQNTKPNNSLYNVSYCSLSMWHKLFSVMFHLGPLLLERDDWRVRLLPPWDNSYISCGFFKRKACWGLGL